MSAASHPSILVRIGRVSLILSLVLMLLIVLGIALGSTGEMASSLVRSFWRGEEPDSLHWTIVMELRFPRVMLAALVGATLGTGGLVFQALLRNPLAEPYILGISGGSAVGAVLDSNLRTSL